MTLPQRILDFASTSPENPAVRCGDRSLTYGQLVAMARRIAAALQAEGAQPGSVIPISAERSAGTIAAILGCWFAGVAFCPIDFQQPDRRVRSLLDEVRASIAIAPPDAHLRAPMRRIDTADLFDDLESSTPEVSRLCATLPGDRAYVIFTSGSTGTPKGVLIEHRSLDNLLVGLCDTVYGDLSAKRVGINAPFIVDASIKQVAMLAAGYCVDVIPQSVRSNPQSLAAYLASHEIDVVDCTPSQLAIWMSNNVLGDVDRRIAVLVGGEKIPDDLWQACAASAHVFFNLYGPTECTVDVSAARITGDDLPHAGRPLPGIEVHVLDAESSAAVGVGEPGMLWVSGVCLARGYLNDPVKTAAEFRELEIGERTLRCYRTGDTALVRASGEIEIHGRIDDQIKVSGFRVDAGDLESVIVRCTDVRSAAVVKAGLAGAEVLVAFAEGGEESEIVDALRRGLPREILPQSVRVLASMPLTKSGKIDRQLLRSLCEADDARSGEAGNEQDGDSVESVVRAEIAKVTGVVCHSADDNLYQVGVTSLQLMAIVGAVQSRLAVICEMSEFFREPCARNLAAAVQRATTVSHAVGSESVGDHPVTEAQEAILTLSSVEDLKNAYHFNGIIALEREMDPDTLRLALAQVTRRHAAYRSRFSATPSGYVQSFGSEAAPPLFVHDIDSIAFESRELSGCENLASRLAVRWNLSPENIERAGALSSAIYAHKFDPFAGDVVRWDAVRFGEDRWILVHSAHHLVHDGWSFHIFVRDLTRAYQELAAASPAPPPELSVAFGEYSARQAGAVAAVREKQLAYWTDHLRGAPARSGFALPTKNDGRRGHSGAWLRSPIDPATRRKIADLARARSVSEFAVLVAAFFSLMHLYSGETDLLAGTSFANRRAPEARDIVGMLVATAPLRLPVSGNSTFSDLLLDAQTELAAAHDNCDVGYRAIVEHVNPARSTSVNPLFQVAINMHDAPLEIAPDFDGRALALAGLGNGSAKFDVNLIVVAAPPLTPDAFEFIWEYSTDLFEAASVERLAGHFSELLQAVVAEPDVQLSGIGFLTEAERAQLLVEWNATKRAFPTDRRVFELVQEHARLRPDSIAVMAVDESLTYRRLNERANRLARYLRGLGVGSEVMVGLCVERGLEMIVGLLGIWKAGGAYVPLDADYPMGRLEFMLSDSGAPVVVTQERLRDRLPLAGRRSVCLDVLGDELARLPGGDLEPVGGPGDLAYLIYTSGSTGTPKGVMVEHSSVTNLACAADYAPQSGAVFAQIAPIAFDGSVFELWVALARGSRLILARPGPVDAGTVRDVIDRGADTLFLTTSLFHELAADPSFSFNGVEQVIAGGDKLQPPCVRSALDRTEGLCVRNGYGPTETTVFATMGVADGSGLSAPIGRPVPNALVYVLDQWMRPAPVGVPGELFVGGAGVARGYWNRPELTTERFIDDPFVAGGRLYRTGDLVRYRDDGQLEFIGRMDDQVKVRGFRIELGEIEAALLLCPGVDHAAVVAREDVPGDKRLVAYIVPSRSWSGLNALRSSVAGVLPAYMVPSAFVELVELPLSANGKVDRGLLPAPEVVADVGRTAGSALEEVLCGLFAEVLGVPSVSVYEDFFNLGGHSLLGIRLAGRVRGVLGVDLGIAELFDSPTVAGLAVRLAERLAGGGGPARVQLLPAARSDRLELSFAQSRLWFLGQLEGPSATYNIPVVVRLSGVVDVAALRAALADLAGRHEVLRTLIGEVDGEPVQVVLPADGISVAVEVSAVAAGRVDALVAQAVNHPFDLGSEIPVRAWLFSCAADEHVFVLLVHHIAGDGWSMRPLLRDLGTAYEARLAGGLPTWEPLPVQYADYAVWQRELLGDERDPESLATAQLTYWRGQLGGLPHELWLPVDRARPSVADSRGGRVRFEVGAEVYETALRMARGCQVTMFMVVHAVLTVFLARSGAGSDVPVGTVVAGRSEEGLNDLVGFFVNTLVLRVDASGDPSFRELLERVRAVDLGAYAHQDVPFEKVVRLLNPVRAAGRHPLFQTLLLFNDDGARDLRLPGIHAEIELGDRAVAKFDLTVQLAARTDAAGDPDGLAGEFLFTAGLFDRVTVEGFAKRFVRLFEQFVRDPDLHISQASLLDGPERARLVRVWTEGAGLEAEERGRTLPELFAIAAARDPLAVAAVADGVELRYGELAERARRLAAFLVDCGVGPESVVALALPRGMGLIVALLAVSMAGGAYLPLDPDYPEARLSSLLGDCAPVCVVTDRDTTGGLEPLRCRHAALRWIELDDFQTGRAAAQLFHEPTPACKPPLLDSLACVLCPPAALAQGRAAAVPHRALTRHLERLTQMVDLRTRDVWAWLSPIGSAGFTREFWGALATGARLVVSSLNICSPVATIAELVARERITVLQLPAFALRQLVAAEMRRDAPSQTATLRTIIHGGGILDRGSVEQWRRHGGAGGPRIIGCFDASRLGGLAESGEDQQPDAGRAAPRGALWRPPATTAAFVLDERLEPMPIGVPGLLYLAGADAVRGYPGSPASTATRCVASPFGEPGTTMHCTGESARWTPDGALELLGWPRRMVEIRGERTDLDEIESALTHCPGVAAVAVVPTSTASHSTVQCYVVPTSPGAVDGSRVRDWYGEIFPGRTLPGLVRIVADIPTTAEGEPDYEALLDSADQPSYTGRAGVRRLT